MALDITGASFGMDTTAAANYIEDIKTNVLKKAGEKLVENVNELQTSVEAAWVGESEQKFMTAIRSDAQMIKLKLEQLTNELTKTFYEARTHINDFDNNLEIERDSGIQG